MGIKKKNITEADKKFIENFTCGKTNCDNNFRFVTSDRKMNSTDPKEKTYTARCDECGKIKFLSDSQFARWNRIFEHGKIEVAEESFDRLFDIE